MLWPRYFPAQKKKQLGMYNIYVYWYKQKPLEWTTLSGVTTTHGLIEYRVIVGNGCSFLWAS